MTTTNFIQVVQPKLFYQVSLCPQCGAPLYVDADTQSSQFTKVIPCIYYTCNCRYNSAPAVSPFYPIYPNPTYPCPNPYPTWITNTIPSDTQCHTTRNDGQAPVGLNQF